MYVYKSWKRNDDIKQKFIEARAGSLIELQLKLGWVMAQPSDLFLFFYFSFLFYTCTSYESKYRYQRKLLWKKSRHLSWWATQDIVHIFSKIVCYQVLREREKGDW